MTDAICDCVIGHYEDDHKLMLEGYAYAATGKVFTIGEFIGLLKHKLVIANQFKYSVVPPQVLKMFIWKGNANKTELFAKFKLGSLYRELESKNAGFCNSISDFINQYLFSLDNIKSPLSDILDSLYIALYLRHRDLNGKA
jgi:hypothetical protein